MVVEPSPSKNASMMNKQNSGILAPLFHLKMNHHPHLVFFSFGVVNSQGTQKGECFVANSPLY